MGVTRTTAADRFRRSASVAHVLAARRLSIQYVALCVASLVATVGLALTYQAQRLEARDIAAGVQRKEVLNLATVSGPQSLEGVFARHFEISADRRFAAAVAYRFLTDDGQHPPQAANVGALATIRVTADEVRRGGPALLRARLDEAGPGASSVSLLTPGQIAELKPSLIVRTPEAFTATFLWVLLLFLGSFHAVAAYFMLRRLRGDPWLLPIAHFLTGLGLIAMLALRDPLRDRAIFADFAIGVSLGCAALAVLGSLKYQGSSLKRLSLVPLVGAIAISLLLILFGSGPGTSDAKVNLLGMQPVEVIRVLLVLFLAGYFATRWDFLRELREQQFGGLELPARFRVPRYDHVLPVVAGVGLALLLFFFQKDLGPALVFACLFLTMYGVARGEVVLVAVGLVLMLAGFAVGYLIGYPGTIVTRVAMWRSPWENAMRGGDQVAHALWAFASGGPAGTGLGLGEPGTIPAAHTDIVLAALAEELGFVGVVAIACLYAGLFYRGFSIALRASGDYAFFLALGLTLSFALPLLLIAGGTLGLFPLSGVATPFLSYGKSSMIANFAVLGMLFGLAREGDTSGASACVQPFVRPVRAVGVCLTLIAVALVARAARVQVLAADRTMATSSLAPQADGGLRYQDNPRLRQVSLLLPRGAVRDRRGIPLAVTGCADLKTHEPVLGQLGAGPCDDRAARHYPLGGHTYHLLGDVRTRVHWAATNTSYEERDHDARLRGFDDAGEVVARRDPRTGRTFTTLKRDYSELVTLWRHRHRPRHSDVRRLFERPRDLRLTIDARLQTRLGRALDRHLDMVGQTRGAVVVMDAASGEVLALVNAPRPRVTDAVSLGTETLAPPDDPAWFDRSRYGLYAPGSTFKVVTAAAALRKDPALRQLTFVCRRLPGGRVGNTVPGWSRPIRDDDKDTVPHGTVAMQRGLEQSCNAYFAQLAIHIGASSLRETARLLDISVADPDTLERLGDALPQAAYGQGQVRLTPFKMARVIAAIASGGRMAYGRWVMDGGDRRDREPVQVMTPAVAAQIASYMRGVVVRGTGQALAGVAPAVAGKTGTAEVEGAPSHAWFAGFAPYGPTKSRRIAFAILVENGGYGARSAAPLAGEVVRAARDLGLITE